jgi:hypothetical protein
MSGVLVVYRGQVFTAEELRRTHYFRANTTRLAKRKQPTTVYERHLDRDNNRAWAEELDPTLYVPSEPSYHQRLRDGFAMLRD